MTTTVRRIDFILEVLRGRDGIALRAGAATPVAGATPPLRLPDAPPRALTGDADARRSLADNPRNRSAGARTSAPSSLLDREAAIGSPTDRPASPARPPPSTSNRTPIGGAPADKATILSPTPATDLPAAEAAGAIPSGTSAVVARISGMAHVVSALMETTQGDAPPAQPIRPLQPLLDAPTTDVARLALALRDSIVHSGLFYESHLAEWALQRCTLADLEREPQSAWIAADAPAQDGSADGIASTTPHRGTGSSAGAPLSAATAAALPHVRMQLETLESGQLRWHGEPWPRQSAYIEIDADGAPPDDDAAAGSSRWRSRLRLTLPHLGTVDVEIKLAGTSIGVAVRPTRHASQVPLANAKPLLTTALAARFAQSAVTVEHAEIG